MLDVAVPYEMFSWAALDVQSFAQKPGLVTCRGGLSIHVSTAFEIAPACDALWVPCGDPDAPARLMDDPERVYLDISAEAQHQRALCRVCLRRGVATCSSGPP
jgi:putative intracellular protease/amidase